MRIEKKLVPSSLIYKSEVLEHKVNVVKKRLALVERLKTCLQKKHLRSSNRLQAAANNIRFKSLNVDFHEQVIVYVEILRHAI